MPVSFVPSAAEFVRFLPEMVLTAMGTLLMVLTPLIHRRLSNVFGHISLGSLAAALAAAVYANGSPGTAFGGMLVVDGFATFFRVLVMSVGLLTVLASYRFLRRQGAEAGEYHALLLFSIAGQSLMAAANDLIVIFIALEISSIASFFALSADSSC